MNDLKISGLYIYPIKSLGGIKLKESHLIETGLLWDRKWMLIDNNGTFITQRKYFHLSLLQVSISDGQITVFHKNDPSQSVSFFKNESMQNEITVSIWDDTCVASEVSPKVSMWFSEFMEAEVRLVRMPDNEKRLVDPRYAHNNEITSFSDGYPCLIIGQASLENLNEQLEDPVCIDRFRPNFVFTGGDAHLEDSFKEFTIGDVQFMAAKPCARCVLITVDQQTGIKSQEPLRTLASYRTFGKKILFGQNLLHKGTGVIHEGDLIKISKWKSEN